MDRKVVHLKSGLTIGIRPILKDGAQRLADGFSHLSPRSFKLRFLTNKGHFTPQELQHMVECDGVTGLSLVALILGNDGVEQDPIAVAHFFRDETNTVSAEFAIAVLDDYQQIGIGYALLTALAEQSKLVGISTWTGICSPDNEGIQKLILKMGKVTHVAYRDGAKVVSIELS